MVRKEKEEEGGERVEKEKGEKVTVLQRFARKKVNGFSR